MKKQCMTQNFTIILIVDDDSSIRSGLSAMIANHISWNYNILEAENGVDALKIFQNTPVDILITDIKMPKMNGLELVSILKNYEISCEVLFLSGYDDYSYIRSAMKIGAYDYLLKPIHLNAFIKALNDLQKRHLSYTNKIMPLKNNCFLEQLDVAILQCNKNDIMDGQGFFDRPLQDADSSDARAKTLELAIVSMAKLKEEETLYHFKTYFSLLSKSVTPSIIRDELTGFIYSLMEKNDGFIKVVGYNKLTDSDMLNIIKSLPTLSQLEARFLELVSSYIQQYQTLNYKKEEYYIRKAKEEIQENLCNDISLTKIASQLHIHPNYLSTLFKNETGINFREYIRELRVQKAKDLLSQNHRIADIAIEVGYQDTAHFNRAFKEVTGTSPSSYRKNEG